MRTLETRGPAPRLVLRPSSASAKCPAKMNRTRRNDWLEIGAPDRRRKHIDRSGEIAAGVVLQSREESGEVIGRQVRINHLHRTCWAGPLRISSMAIRMGAMRTSQRVRSRSLQLRSAHHQLGLYARPVRDMAEVGRCLPPASRSCGCSIRRPHCRSCRIGTWLVGFLAHCRSS